MGGVGYGKAIYKADILPLKDFRYCLAIFTV